MARINAFYGFDQDILNLNLINRSAIDVEFQTGPTEKYKGVTADSAYAVTWAPGFDEFYTVFAGDGLTTNSNDDLTGGTIKIVLDGYEEYDPNFDEYFFFPTLEILDVDIDAAALFAASETARTSDDEALFVDALSGDDVFRLSADDDLARGFDGNDRLFGNGGADSLFGGAGRDVLFGGNGGDGLQGQGGNDRILGGKGADFGNGGAGKDRLFGDKGNDTLFGGGGSDSLFGGGDNDRLAGGARGDLLNGGRGNDLMFGGAGADIFVFAAGKDTIRDYETRDIVQIKAGLLGAGEMLADVDRLDGGGNLVLDFGKHELRFVGVESLDDLGTVEFV